MKNVYLHRVELDVKVLELLKVLEINIVSVDAQIAPDYIIYSGESELYEIEELFDLKIGQIQLIHIGNLKESDRFFMNGGSLSLSEEQVSSGNGITILERFLKRETKLRLGDRLQNHNEQSSALITNHLQTGLYFDRIATSAFQENYNPLLIRGYLDHTIGYFTYLAQSGLGSIPIEVEWTSNDNEFIVNTYLKVKNFSKEYLIDCLGDLGGAKPLSYLLTVASKSCDHLDISYFDKSERLCFTGYWNLDTAPSLFSSLSINNISTLEERENNVSKGLNTIEDQIKASEKNLALTEELSKKPLPHGFLIKAQFDNKQLVDSPDKTKNIIETLVRKINEEGDSVQNISEERLSEIISEMPTEEQIQGLTKDSVTQLQEALKTSRSTEALSKEVMTNSLDQSEEISKTVGENLVKDLVDRTSASLDRESIRALLSDAESVSTVRGQKDREDFKQIIKGEREKPELIMRVKGEFTDLADNFKQVVSSSSNVKDKKGAFRNLIDSKLTELSSSPPNPINKTMKSFVDEVLPREIELGLEEYAKSIGKTFDDLEEGDLEIFQDEKLPNIISGLTNEDGVADEFEESLDEDHSPHVDLNFREKLRKKLISSDNLDSIEDEQLQILVKSTLEETIAPDIIHIQGTTENPGQKKDMLVRAVAGVLSGSEQVEEIVEGALRSSQDLQDEATVTAFKKSQAVDSFESDNIVEKELLEKLKIEKLARRKAETQLSLVQGQLDSNRNAKKRIDKVQQKISEKVESEQGSSELEDSADEKLTAKIKKLELESTHKDTLFNSEISKIERVLRGKEIILEKTKSSYESKVKNLLSENSSLKDTMNRLEMSDALSDTTFLKKQLRSLKKENELLAKNSSVIKSRLEEVSKGRERKSSDSDLQVLLEDNRKLKALKNEYVNKSQSVEKEKKALESKLLITESRESSLRDEAIKANQNFLELESQMKMSMQSEARRISESAQAKDQDSAIAKEYNSVKTQYLQLHKKLKDLMENSKGTTGASGKPSLSPKERHLEKDKQRLQVEVKKHRSDLDEAKKIVMKFKGENIKMKNELEKLKRDKDRVEKKLRDLASAAGKKAA